MTIIRYEVEDGVAILTWDDAERSMNVLSGAALAELDAAVTRAVEDEAVKGLVLTSGKQGIFVAGGDLEQIAELDRTTALPQIVLPYLGAGADDPAGLRELADPLLATPAEHTP